MGFENDNNMVKLVSSSDIRIINICNNSKLLAMASISLARVIPIIQAFIFPHMVSKNTNKSFGKSY